MIGYIDNYNDNLLINKLKSTINTKNAVILFHKNIDKIYKKAWIDKCIESILNQQSVNFDIIELNYGNKHESLFSNITLDIKGKHYFFVQDFENHIEAMNFLLHICFDVYKYDIVFNTNLDDYYDERRFILQLIDIKYNNNILNSGLVTYIHDNGDQDVIYKKDEDSETINRMICHNNIISWVHSSTIASKCLNNLKIDFQNIKSHLLSNNNIINHSCVCFSKQFWNSCDIYNNKLYYRNLIPYEDLELWVRTISNNKNKIGIVNRNLILYRIHDKQISSTIKTSDELQIISYNYSLLFNIHNCNIDYLKTILDKINKKNITLFLIYNPNTSNESIEDLKNHKFIKKIIMIPEFELSYKDILTKYYFKLMLNCEYFILVDKLKDEIQYLSMKDICNKFDLLLNYNRVN